MNVASGFGQIQTDSDRMVHFQAVAVATSSLPNPIVGRGEMETTELCMPVRTQKPPSFKSINSLRSTVVPVCGPLKLAKIGV